MANEKNLISIGDRTKAEQREITSKGGQASAKARRRKKTLKQGLERLLAAPVSAATDKKKLSAMGIPVEDMTNEELVTLALVRKAMAGDVRAFETVRDTIGENLAANHRREFDQRRLELQAAQIEASNAGTMGGLPPDDGFLAALNAHVDKLWDTNTVDDSQEDWVSEEEHNELAY